MKISTTAVLSAALFGLSIVLGTPGTTQAREVALEPFVTHALHVPNSVERIVPSSRGTSRTPSPDISTPTKFIAVVAEAAQESQRSTGVPSSVTIAQAILESNWGASGLAKQGHNYFGIKAHRGAGPAGIIKMNTWEVLGGANVVVNDGFRAYHNIFESVQDHGRFLKDNARYSAAFVVTGDAKEFALRIHAAGYATDPAYSSKLIQLMDKYNLYRYDTLSGR